MRQQLPGPRQPEKTEDQMSTTATATPDTPEVLTEVPAGTWDVDPVHSTIGFEVRHLGISTFRGRFNGFNGAIESDENGLQRVEGEIEASSIDINDPQLGGHLQGEDFFHSEVHPKLRFASTAVEGLGEGVYRVAGELEMRGVSKPIELDVRVDGVGSVQAENDRISLIAEGVVDRTAYGMTWNSTLANGLPALAEKVRLVLNVEAVRRSE
jgi:polyisoprenoid-binding protein YceI